MFSRFLRTSGSIRLWTHQSQFCSAMPQHRGYSVPNTYSTPFSVNSHPDLQAIHKNFMSAFPTIMNDLVEYVAAHDSHYASKHLVKALDFNVPHGKMIRSLTYIKAYQQISEESPSNSYNIDLAYVIGWCIEMLQASILIVDDIIDCSEMRRNQLCWYNAKNAGSLAVNDAMMIENGLYYILKKYANKLPYYVDIIELFHETSLATSVGQLLDLKLVSGGVSKFTMELHKSLSDHKTSHFAFYFPIALAALSYGPCNRDQLIGICNEIGHYYQVQNDFLDCFGGTGVMKKNGTDIKDGKCTWLAIKSLELGSNQDKDILSECYGKNDTSCIERVRQVYENLKLPDLYCQYEEETYKKICDQIQAIPLKVQRTILRETLNRTFNRSLA